MKGTWREGLLAGDPEEYVEKALETGISFHWGPHLGNLEEGSSTGDFERRMKGALEVWCLSLWELCEGNPEGGLPCWGPRRICRKGSGDGHLFP